MGREEVVIVVEIAGEAGGETGTMRNTKREKGGGVSCKAFWDINM